MTVYIKDGVIRYVPNPPSKPDWHCQNEKGFVQLCKSEEDQANCDCAIQHYEYETALSKALEGSIEFEDQEVSNKILMDIHTKEFPNERFLLSRIKEGTVEIQLGEVEIVRQYRYKAIADIAASEWFDVLDHKDHPTCEHRQIARLKGETERERTFPDVIKDYHKPKREDFDEDLIGFTEWQDAYKKWESEHPERIHLQAINPHTGEIRDIIPTINVNSPDSNATTQTFTADVKEESQEENQILMFAEATNIERKFGIMAVLKQFKITRI